jgi:GT2 family glycosyltransferase
MERVKSFLGKNQVDAFGGPDAADGSFNILQKSINYAMTSFLTTGGIRGSSEKIEKFHPRSFNMGISKEVFLKTGGFPTIRFAYAKAAGEDLDLSIQIIKLGFKTALIPDAFVYHKRRTSLQQFFKQVFNFGIARITISKRHPESLKLVHFAPALLLVVALILLLLSVFKNGLFLLPILLFVAMIFIDSTIKNRSIYIGFVSVVTSLCQITGYGYGFIIAFWKQRILKKTMF